MASPSIRGSVLLLMNRDPSIYSSLDLVGKLLNLSNCRIICTASAPDSLNGFGQAYVICLELVETYTNDAGGEDKKPVEYCTRLWILPSWDVIYDDGPVGIHVSPKLVRKNNVYALLLHRSLTY